MHREILANSLRELRRQRGLSLTQLARATGISSSFLSVVEQAGSDITIGRLLRLADFYGVELTDLLTGDHAAPEHHLQVLKADAEIMHSEQEGVDVYDLAAGAHWMLVPMLGIHQPGGTVEVNDLHEREVMLFVLEGTFEIAFVNDQPVRLVRGQGAIYRSVAPYRVTNVGKARGRVLTVHTRPE